METMKSSAEKKKRSDIVYIYTVPTVYTSIGCRVQGGKREENYIISIRLMMMEKRNL